MSLPDQRAENLTALNEALDCWVELSKKQCAGEMVWHRALGLSDELLKIHETGWHEGTSRMAEEARPFLSHFLRDNSELSAKELEELAGNLSPGGTHTGGWLAMLIREELLSVDPILMAAIIRLNWQGGKTGFQFLPDPAKMELEEYQYQAEELIELLIYATKSDPRCILTGEDRDFYDSLPERFTVYRGCAGISPDMAAVGVCWTTKRDVAEWFAHRAESTQSKGQVVITARIKKQEVALVNSSESEIVVLPGRARPIKCRVHPEGWRPAMGWRGRVGS